MNLELLGGIKMEELDRKLQNEINDLVNFFESVKKQFGDLQYVFLSERFMNIYKYLEQDYPSIRLSNICLNEDILNTKLKKIYLNDINYEFPKKIKIKDIILVKNFCLNYSGITSPILNLKIPTITEQDKEIASKKKNFMSTKHAHQKLPKQIKLRRVVTCTNILNSLGLELKLLENNEFENAIDLLPDFLQNYFNFIIENQECLNFYLKSFYCSLTLSDCCDDASYDLLRSTIINDMIEIFGKEKLNSKTTQFLLEQKGGYLSMAHYPLDQVTEAILNYDSPVIEDGKIKRIGR